MDSNLAPVVALIAVALVFDFINGFHDAANSIATVVSTRVLTPGKAVIWAAFFNFVAAFTFGTAVAKTVGAGLVDIIIVSFSVIFAGLIGRDRLGPDHVVLRAADELVARAHRRLRRRGSRQGRLGRNHRVGLDQDAHLHRPGAAHRHDARVCADGGDAVDLPRALAGPRRPVVPAAAAAVGRGLQPRARRQRRAEDDGDHRRSAVRRRLPRLEDGHLPIPLWVVLSAHAAIALGTLSGGWRIIHTMGSKITKLQPVGGFAAETAGAISLFTATHLGVPVSTTHTITGAIIGVGSIRRLSAVRWGVAGRIVWAWVLTIPASAFIAAVTYRLVSLTIAP